MWCACDPSHVQWYPATILTRVLYVRVFAAGRLHEPEYGRNKEASLARPKHKSVYCGFLALVTLLPIATGPSLVCLIHVGMLRWRTVLGVVSWSSSIGGQA